MMARSWACLFLVVVIGCAAPAEEPAVDLQAERSSLMEADAAWFASHEDLDRFVTFLADDALFMPDGAPLARGEAIRTTWEGLLSMPGFGLEWQATGSQVAEAGDMGYTFGAYELTVDVDGASMVTVGKYVTLWKKQADGSWKVAADCFNSDGPPTEA